MFWSTHERNAYVDQSHGSGVQKTKFGNVFSGKYPGLPSTDSLKDLIPGGQFIERICPLQNPFEQNAYVAMTQSEKETVEAIKEHFSFEDDTEQSSGFAVNENKAIEIFSSSCRFDKDEQKYVVKFIYYINILIISILRARC